MKTRINGKELDAPIVDGIGYADMNAAIDALGGPVNVVSLAFAALGIQVRADDGETGPLVPLRKLAEAMKLPHEYTRADDTFHIGELTPPAYPIPDLGVGFNVDPWLPVTPAIAYGAGQRSADSLRRVIAQFKVAANPRYEIRDTTGDGEDDTFCNIFAWDFGAAMDAPLPHYLDAKSRPSKRGEPGAWETSANALVGWLKEFGWIYGWVQVNAARALEAANQGKPAVAGWINPTGGSGHIAVVRPGVADPVKGIPIAQSGKVNFESGFLVDGFGVDRISAVRFYIHD